MNAEFDMTQHDKLKNESNASKRISLVENSHNKAPPTPTGNNAYNTSYSSFYTETFNPEEAEEVEEVGDRNYEDENENDTFTSISSSNV